MRIAIVCIAVGALSAWAAGTEPLSHVQGFDFVGGEETEAFDVGRAGAIASCPLLSVSLELSLDISGSVLAFDNDEADATEIEVSFGASASVQSGDVSIPSLAVNVLIHELIALGPDDEGDGIVFFDDDGGPDFAVLDLEDAVSSDGFTLPTILNSQFECEGVFGTSVMTDQILAIDGGGLVAFAIEPSIPGRLTVTDRYECTPCQADLDGDGDVDLADFGVFGAQFGDPACESGPD